MSGRGNLSGQTMVNVALILAIILLIAVGIYFFRPKKEAPLEVGQPAPVVTPKAAGPRQQPTPKPFPPDAQTNTGVVETRDPTPQEVEQERDHLIQVLPQMIESAKKAIAMTTDPNARRVMEMRLQSVEITLENMRKVDPHRKDTWKYMQQAPVQ